MQKGDTCINITKPIKSLKTSEDLLPANVIINDDVIIKHVEQQIHRTMLISNSQKKPYYFMTEYIDPGFIYHVVSKRTSGTGQTYNLYNFILKSKTRINQKENPQHDTNDDINKENDNSLCQNTNVDFHQDQDINDNDVGQNINNDVMILIDRLNCFKRGLTERIKYRTMIPKDYPDQKVYYMSARTIKLDCVTKLKNIIEFQDLKNNFNSKTVSNVLRYCRCKLLLKIDSVTITHTNVFLNICLIRIFPENFDSLRGDTKLYIFKELNFTTTKNINTYNNLNCIVRKRASTKAQVRKELMNLMSK